MSWLKWNAVAYSSTTMAAILMNSVFQFYYVKLFVSNYKISTYWFNLSQIVYLIWNAVNDPLFGYFQDYSKIRCLKHRQLNILYGAPLFVLSFLIPWFQWGDANSPEWVTGVHLLVCLSVYDSLFTFVLLAQCSLFAEISKEKLERQSLLQYNQYAAILGTSALFLTEFASNQMTNILGLQISCVAIAGVSFVLLFYSGKKVKVTVNRTQADKDVDGGGNWSTAFRTTFEILRNKNFLTFVVMNFCQVLHATYCANFFSIFRDYLFGSDALPQFVQTIAAGSSFLFPPVLVLLIQPIIPTYGSYWIINYSFVFKILMSISLYFIGYETPILVAGFMILDSTFVGAAFSLFNLSVSDIIDEDQHVNRRSHPVSSMVFGLNALVTKPAQSIAPMVVVYILNSHGYKADNKDVAHGSEELKNVMFLIMVCAPLVLGIIQMICWRSFVLGVGRTTQKISSETI